MEERGEKRIKDFYQFFFFLDKPVNGEIIETGR
jgi:hypothetical protein